MPPLTDVDWQRLTLTIGRLADQVDDDGRDDLHMILDLIEQATEQPTRS